VRYDWIVSGPPKHRGELDDFRVLQQLIRGAPQRLCKVGILWMVAQGHVPMGCLLTAAGDFDNVSTIIYACGRFIVWRAACSNHAKELNKQIAATIVEVEQELGAGEANVAKTCRSEGMVHKQSDAMRAGEE